MVKGKGKSRCKQERDIGVLGCNAKKERGREGEIFRSSKFLEFFFRRFRVSGFGFRVSGLGLGMNSRCSSLKDLPEMIMHGVVLYYYCIKRIRERFNSVYYCATILPNKDGNYKI